MFLYTLHIPVYTTILDFISNIENLNVAKMYNTLLIKIIRFIVVFFPLLSKIRDARDLKDKMVIISCHFIKMFFPETDDTTYHNSSIRYH